MGMAEKTGGAGRKKVNRARAKSLRDDVLKFAS
jgi:hypothetical protein